MFEVHDTQTHHDYVLHHGTVLYKNEDESEECRIVLGDGAETDLDWVSLGFCDNINCRKHSQIIN